VDGDLVKAIMIAGIPVEDALCGITFGLNGTCHQRVNRILWCCTGHPVIRNIPGWNVSYLFFGDYGNGWENYRMNQIGE